MRSYVLIIVFVMLTLSGSAHAQAASNESQDSLDHRRFGLLGAIAETGFRAGLVFEHEKFEVQVLSHAVFQEGGDRDIETTLKLGVRLDIGTRNWLALGAEGETTLGSKLNGRSANGSYGLGPYIAIERYFADTPVMVCLWVNPVMYEHFGSSGSAGGGGHVVRIIQTGGFGMAYLFL